MVELGLWEEWRRCESHQSLNRIPFGRWDGGWWWLRKSEVMRGKVFTTNALHFPAKYFWASFNFEMESPKYPCTFYLLEIKTPIFTSEIECSKCVRMNQWINTTSIFNGHY